MLITPKTHNQYNIKHVIESGCTFHILKILTQGSFTETSMGWFYNLRSIFYNKYYITNCCKCLVSHIQNIVISFVKDITIQIKYCVRSANT